MSIRIDFLSYEGERSNERHPHAQFVLPIAGELEISIGGAEGRLSPSCAAFVAPGVPHSQLATVSNAFLIVNCDLAECGVPAAEQLAEQIFLPVSEATRHLIGFAELSRDRFSQPGTTQCWMPLLLNSFLERPLCRPSRLAALERLSMPTPARRGLWAKWPGASASAQAGCTHCPVPNGASARRHGWRNAVSAMCENGWRNRICRLRSWRCGPGMPIKARSPAPCSV